MTKLGIRTLKLQEPIVTKFGMGDYVGNVTRKPKFKPIATVFRQMCEIGL